MKIYDLLNEIMAEIDESRKSLFGNKKTIDVDFVLDILEEITDSLPEELVYAQDVLDHKKEILDDAQQKAQEMLDGAEGRLEELLDEHRVTQLAYEKSNRLVANAQQQAYEIRMQADDYALSVLDDLSAYMRDYIGIVQENRSNFVSKKNKDQEEFQQPE